MAIVGSAYIVIHADTKAVKGEIEKAFSGIRPAINKLGEDLGKEFAQSFGDSMRGELDGIIPDVLDQDVTQRAREAAADYSDEFSTRLGEEMNDVVARTLADDSDGLSVMGEQDAGQYAGGFADASKTHFEGLIAGILDDTDYAGLGSSQGDQWSSGFTSSVSGTSVSPNVNTNQARNDGNLLGAVMAAGAAEGLAQGGDEITDGFSTLGGDSGRGFTSAFKGIFDFGDLFGSAAEIEAARESLVVLIGTGNLIGPAIAQAVAAISALAQGLFSLGAAAAQATPSLVVLPSLISGLIQGGLTLAVAFQGVGAALKTALTPGTTAADLQADLEKLTPEAQAFVLAVRGSRDEIIKLREAAQKTLFPGLTSALDNLVNDAFPTFRDILRSTGSAIGDLAKNFSQRLTDPANLKNLSTVADTNVRSIRTLGNALIQVGEAFTAVLAAASPLINRFTQWIATLASGASAFLQVRAASGDLTQTFNEAGDVAAQLGDIFGNLLDGIRSLARAAAPAGRSLLDSLQGVSEEFANLTQASLTSGDAFTRFGNVASTMREIGTFARQLLDIFIDLGADGSVADTFRTLQDSVPAIRSIADDFASAGPALAQLFVSAVGFVDALTQSEGITSFLNTLNRILETLTAILNLPLVAEITSLLVPLVGIVKAFEFFWIGAAVVIKGLVGPLTLIGSRMAAFTTSTIAAREASVGLGTSVVTGMRAATAATTEATIATQAFATATSRVRLTQAFSGVGALSAATAASPIVGATQAVGGLASKTTLAAKATSALRIASTALIGVPLTAFGAAATGAFAGLGAAFYLTAQASDAYLERLKASAAVIGEAQAAHQDVSDSVLQESDAFKQYSEVVGENNASLDQFRQALVGPQSQLDDLKNQMVELSQIRLRTEDGTGLTGNVLPGTEDTAGIEKTAQAIEIMRQEIQDTRDSLDEEARAAGFASFQHQLLTAEAEQAAQTFNQTVEAYNNMVDSAIAAREANAQVSVSLRDLRTNLKSLDTNKGKLTGQSFIDFTNTFRQLRDISTQLASLGKTKQAEQALLGVRDALKQLKDQGDLSADAYRRLLKQFDLTPNKIETRVQTLGVVGAAQQLADLKAQKAALKPGTPEYLILDAQVDKARKRLHELRAEWTQSRDFPPAAVRVSANTDGVKKKLDDLVLKNYNAEITTKADVTEAENTLQKTINKQWDTIVKAEGDTDSAESSIQRIINRAWRTTIQAGGDTQDAVDEIYRVINKKYSTTIGVEADTSAVGSAIANAFNAAYRISTSAGGQFSFTPAATGWVIPGYAPGQDRVPVLASPGEAIVRPEAVRELSPNFFHALNRDWKRIARLLKRGGVPKFATGGIVGDSSTNLRDFLKFAASLGLVSSNVATASTATGVPFASGGSTIIVQPSARMDEIELAEIVSRRQAFMKRRGT